MKFYLGVTDANWFNYLSGLYNPEDITSGRRVKLSFPLSYLPDFFLSAATSTPCCRRRSATVRATDILPPSGSMPA